MRERTLYGKNRRESKQRYSLQVSAIEEAGVGMDPIFYGARREDKMSFLLRENSCLFLKARFEFTVNWMEFLCQDLRLGFCIQWRVVGSDFHIPGVGRKLI